MTANAGAEEMRDRALIGRREGVNPRTQILSKVKAGNGVELVGLGVSESQGAIRKVVNDALAADTQRAHTYEL